MRLERFLLGIFVLGLGGTAAELLLSGHTESGLQWIPLALMALALPAVAHQWTRTTASLPLRAVRWLFLASGVVGSVREVVRIEEPSLPGSGSDGAAGVGGAGISSGAERTLAHKGDGMKRILVLAAAVMAALVTMNAEVGKSSLVDPNLAAEKDLAALPHMTPALVKGIVDKRPFLTMTDFDTFLSQTLSQEQRMELYAKTFVQINLNTCTDAEILMIPNAGRRMVREFKEYRSYPNLAKFRREIGKYVNAAEVARLEQYVFVPVNLNTASDEDLMTIPGMGARMLREFKEYRPYDKMDKFRREIGKYVSPKEVSRFERYVTIE